jgi:hypothetical protein
MNKLKKLIPVTEQHIAKALLVRAREALNPAEGEFVCVNLKEAAETPVERRVSEIIRAEIRFRLNGYTTVCSWLNEKTGIDPKTIHANGGKRMVEYRKRWIDSMIAELR